jgi:ectoine hydroxylase-related dioxygenase (phytanoyl-CoA dioxygenase family)
VNAAPAQAQPAPVAPATDRHTVPYRIRNHDLKDPARPVEVLASPEEIEQLAQDGYLARPNTLSPERVTRLRAAIDEVAAAELGAAAKVSTSSRFGGLFLRHLADKHQAFLDLLTFQPVLSVVRGVLGPQVQLRGFSARISYPNEPNQETHWHFHQRVVPDPLPAFYSRPQSIEALLYLDDANDASGPLSVVPGSHNWIERDLAAEQYGDLPGQVTLRPTAGTCVFVHGSLWHRAHANTPQGHLRRLLIVGYGPTWMKPSIYGAKPQNGLTAKLLEDADAETKELLGLAGWM